MTNLSIAAQISWKIAASEAGAAESRYIEKEHLLVGIFSIEKVVANGFGQAGIEKEEWQDLKTEYSLFRKVMRSFGIDQTILRRMVRKGLGKSNYKHLEKTIHRSEECKATFERASALSGSLSAVTILHLTAAILEKPGEIVEAIFSIIGVDFKVLKDTLLSPPEKVLAEDNADNIDQNPYQSYLERYGRDLNEAARDDKLGPFVGRRNELLQVIQTLARSMKNNPVLVGEAGVGKTAIVEALALRSVQGKDPRVLSGKKIIELNLGAILGGTKYRGEFEERLTRIIEEAKADPNIILFIDEIHNLVGAGSVGGGSMDAANIMKPALARGDIKCIGATTIGEYRRYIESDTALERRFEKIIVNEPSRDETVEILKGIRQKWEDHFNRKFTDKALEAAVDLSIRFDVDHNLPDKAIDLVDKAGAKIRVPFLSMIQELNPLNPQAHKDAFQEEVTEYTVAEVLSEKVGIPLEIIEGHLEGITKSVLLEMNTYLIKRIIGQDEAMNRISQRLLMAHAGMGRKSGPLSVFMFLGPTGVGKTETAKAVAEFLFGSEAHLIRFDMSEYMEEHSVAKLTGSPPGYIGHDEEGQLTGKLRTKPYSVVLLDEIEKAHPRIFDLFLQVFDDGRITDSKGRTVDVRNSIFIMTSNIQPKTVKKLGFLVQDEKETAKTLLGDVKQFFRPELINRIDELIVFHTLSEDNVGEILKKILNEISIDIKERFNARLEFTEEAEKYITLKGYSAEYGVRELRRTVEKFVQIPLSNLILSGKLKEHKEWQAVCSNEEISLVPKI